MQDTVGIYAHYGIKGIPHYVIVSPEGRIIHVWSGYGTGVLKKKLEESGTKPDVPFHCGSSLFRAYCVEYSP